MRTKSFCQGALLGFLACFLFAVSWDARTRPQGRRTRVRRGGTRGRGRDAADRASLPRRTASCHVARPESGRRGWSRRRFGGNRRRRGQNRADSVRIGRIGLYRPKRPSQAEIKKKKKKKVQTHHFTNLKTPDPSHFVQPLSLRPSSPFSVSLTVLRPSS